MKAICRAAVSIVVFTSFVAISAAQTAPNLENGWKHFGSYDGTHIDSVNLMNGNLMLHAPVLPDYPQRGGKFAVPEFLYITSKNWQVVCKPDSSLASGENCFWQPTVQQYTSGTSSFSVAGAFLQTTFGVIVQRTIDRSGNGTGGVTYTAMGYSLTGPDGASHQLYPFPGTADANGEATKFESIDNSGYHLEVSNPDSNGVAATFTVTDRNGNRYQDTVNVSSVTCGAISGNKLPPARINGGSIAPTIDDAPFGDQYCPQAIPLYPVVDSNGNQMDGVTDSLGRPAPIIGNTPTTDFSDCVSQTTIHSAVLLSYNTPAGSRSVKLCYSSIPVQTAFNQPGVAESQNSTIGGASQLLVLTTLIQADGSKWTLQYDSYGEVAFVGLPSGGSLSYTWTTVPLAPGCSTQTPVSRAVLTRTLNDNNGHSSVWNYQWGTYANGALINTVTDPLNNDTEHTFSALQGIGLGLCAFYETRTRYYQGTAGSRQLQKQVDTTYSSAQLGSDSISPEVSIVGNVLATTIQTTVYPSGKVSKVVRQYDTGLGINAPSFGNVTKEQEFDWGPGQPGPLLRETDTVYQWQKTDASGNQPYLTAHLLDLPASVVVISGNAAENTKSNCPVTPTSTANCMAETDFVYDEPAYLTTPSPAVTTQHVAPPYGVRGNLTTISRWLNTSNSFIPSHTNWYDTGEVYQAIDPLGHTTTYSYDPAYAGAYVTQTCSPQTGTFAHCVSGTYDFNTGVLTSLTDENATSQASGNTQGDAAHTSNYAYDYMFRLASAQAPPSDPANPSLRPTTTFNFSSAGVFPIAVQRLKLVSAGVNDSVTSFFDGLGRAYKAQHVLPNGTATVDTTFDLAGHIATVSNPYFSTSDPTYGLTTTQYDGLDRVTQVTRQDGSLSTVSYIDNCTTSTDEAGKQRRACSDALGRLTSIDEPGDSTAGASPVVNGGGTAATGWVAIAGGEQNKTVTTIGGGGGGGEVCSPGVICDGTGGGSATTTIYDQGTVRITVGSSAYTATFGGNDTTATIATNLANSVNNDLNGLVWASTSGGTLNLSSRATGSQVSYSLSVSWTWDTTNFTAASFTATSSGGIAGGADGPPVFSGHAYTTLYRYDALSNLICVEQHGNSPAGAHGDGTSGTGCSADPANDATSTWRVRRFTYDSFSRLLTARNPESGMITYSYDNDGSVSTQTDPRGIVTTFAYDALHRVTSKSHSDGTFGAGYTYDQTGVWGVPETNAIGRLVLAYDGHSAATLFSYDALGRITTQFDCPPSTFGVGCPMVQASYDLAGDLTRLVYPNGEVVNYAVDSAGRALSAIESSGSPSFVSGATYGPDGGLTGYLNGSGGPATITSSFSYNKRLQPLTMSASIPSQTIFSIGYDFHAGNGTAGSGTDNGNVYGIYNYRDRSRDQSFTYDPLNRLQTAQNAGTNCAATTVNGKTEYWGNSYTYDPWGNLTGKTVTKCSAENMSVVGLANNRLSGYSYDLAGNMTNDGAGHALTFDAENRISQVNSGAVRYTYDPTFGRVRKDVTGQPSTEYFYFGGEVIAEKNVSTGAWTNYVFFDGERVARREFPAGSVFYYFSDHLKTASVITDASGTIKAESDYYPWGGELQFVNNDSNDYKFTGKKRDGETGLDYFGARYYSNGLSRWVSADWSATPVPVPYAHFGDPQTLNLYGYVRNTPTTLLDLDGHQDVPRGRPPAEDEALERKEEEAERPLIERANENVRKEKLEKEAAEIARAKAEFAKEHPDGYDEPGGQCVARPPGPTIGPPEGTPAPPVASGPPTFVEQNEIAPFTPGGKTIGLLGSPGSRGIPIFSGVKGPAEEIPKGTPGFTAYTRTHVEGHVAAFMRLSGIKNATLVLNNPQVCAACTQNLPTMLPPGSQLTIITPNGQTATFYGNAK